MFMRKDDFFLLIQKYLDGKASEQETNLLHEWYDSFDDSEVSVPGNEDESLLREKMLSRFRDTIHTGKATPGQSKTVVLKRKFGWMGIAAILLVLLTGGYFLIQKMNTGNKALAEN